MSEAPTKCPRHTWAYFHGVIDGPKPDQCVIVRKCDVCGLKQMATTHKWRKAKGDYALEEHYNR